MASSRCRLRLCFSAWVRGEEFGEEEDEGFGWLLEQSLTAPLPASVKLRTRPVLIILNQTLYKKQTHRNTVTSCKSQRS